MDAVLECCVGLDVHQETVVACVLFGPLESKPKKEIKTFGTTTPELLLLADWLEEKSVPMWRWKVRESIGSPFGTYWRLDLLSCS